MVPAAAWPPTSAPHRATTATKMVPARLTPRIFLDHPAPSLDLDWRLAGDEPVDGTVERGRVDVAGVVLPKRAQRRNLQAKRPVVHRARSGRRREAPQLSGAEVAIEVASVERGKAAIADDVAAGDRAAD